jgi:glutaconyl-CoA/methylmalonyl-CoA decarboxylase subunit gamma
MNIFSRKSDKKLIASIKAGDDYTYTILNNQEYSYKRKKLNASIVEDPDGITFFQVNDTKYPVEIISVKQNEYELMINGVAYTFTVETPFSFERKKMLEKKQRKSGKELIIAPIPGKVLEVLVEKGQTVAMGDALLVLEAMKMQNTICATKNGVVKGISVTSGSLVSKDDLMVEIG